MVCTVTFTCQGSNTAASQPSHIQMCFMDALTDPPLQLCSPVGMGDESRDGTWESAAKFLLGDRAHPGSQCCGLLPQLSGGRDGFHQRNTGLRLWRCPKANIPLRCWEDWATLQKEPGSTAALWRTGALPPLSCSGMGPQSGPSTTHWDSRPTTELLSPRTTQAGPSATGCLKYSTWPAAVCSTYAP